MESYLNVSHLEGTASRDDKPVRPRVSVSLGAASWRDRHESDWKSEGCSCLGSLELTTPCTPGPVQKGLGYPPGPAQQLAVILSGAWRRGECPGSKDRGLMFDSLSRLRHSRPFHFEAYNEGPPLGPRMSL